MPLNRARRRGSADERMTEDEVGSASDVATDSEEDDERSASEVFGQIVDVFLREVRLENLQTTLETGRGAGLVRDARKHIQDQIRRQRHKIRDKILQSRLAWQKKTSDPPFCRFIDKMSFTVGILGSLVTVCLLGRSSDLMVKWYTYLIVLLISLRIYLYRKEGYQYFLIDFCYFTTGLVYMYLYLYPKSSTLFVHVFAFANGPLAWAVPLWRNSLVFHDLDKLTSCAIHILPMLLTFQLRWFPSDSSLSVCGDEWPSCGTVALKDIAVYPLLPYVIWQIAYTLKTQSKFLRLSKPVSVADDDLMQTSFKWLLSANEGPVFRILQKFPTLAAKEAAFIVLQFLFTFVTMVPTLLYFHSFAIHLIFLCLIITLAAWNGANFYVEVWTSRYKWANRAKLEAAARELSAVSQPDVYHGS
ncbi:Glycerophosphocholine acyltransferase 1 [Plasmodiophora brassicae]